MDFNKKLSKSGSVTIPAAMRRELGLQPGERFKIVTNPQGVIELKRIQGECIFCKDDQSLINYEGRFICNECAQKIAKAGIVNE